MATVSDPDGAFGAADGSGTPAYQWYVSKVTQPLADEDDHWIMATGSGDDTVLAPSPKAMISLPTSGWRPRGQPLTTPR